MQQLRSLFQGMMHALYEQQGASLNISILTKPEAQSFIQAHAATLDGSFRQVPMSDNMRSRLQRSDYIFSGIKTFHELNEAFPSLIDENGNRKPFERFLNDVQNIDATYNQNFLRAEYNHAQASAEMAAKWERFQEDGDRYNLQYRTAGDDKVRPEHAALDRVTLPIDDPFWDTYYPPNGWNCRCTVVQVRKSKYTTTPHDEAMSLGEQATGTDTRGIFHYNPGKEQKTFPDYNPYTISKCNSCPVAKGSALGGFPAETLAFVPENELCAACRLIRMAQATRTSQRLTPSEFRTATTKANEWADQNLTPTVINGVPSKRTTIVAADGHELKVGKKFFTETAAKNKRNPELVHVLRLATEFQKWVPNATRIRVEDGIDHDYQFSVYRVTYQGQTIEFKCKLTNAEILYTMRALP